MPEPTDPFSRLERLAPSVDAEAATTAFGQRRAARARRRRAVTGGALAVVGLLAVGAAVAVARSGDDGQTVLAGSTTEAPTSTTAGPTLEGERHTTTRFEGLTIALDTPPEATVGDRLWVDVTLTNDRPDPITVGTVAPCAEPISALAGSPTAVNAVELDTGFGAFSVDPPAGKGLDSEQWSGDLGELPGVLADGQPPKVIAGREAGQLVTTSTTCADIGRSPEPIAPGGSVERRIAIDLRWVEPGSVDGDGIDVLASTGRITAADGTDLGKATARQEVALRDPSDRQASYDAATGPDGIAAAPTLPEWLTLTQQGAPPQTEQRYSAALTWWQGAWEAWLLPAWGDGHQADALRIRFDPDRMEVVDVRTVFWNLAPSDDPDQPESPEPNEPVEDVRYHVD